MLITKLSQRYFSHLSEGEKQIALIARALIKNPEILILDEPIANLDLKSKFYVTDQINDCLLYTSPSPRDRTRSRMPSSA